RVDTVVTCGNLAPRSVIVAFEIFGEQDQPAGASAYALAAIGNTVTFATSAAAGVPTATVVANLQPVLHGKARISATSAQISCVASNRIRNANGVAIEVPVALLKKVARKDTQQ